VRTISRFAWGVSSWAKNYRGDLFGVWVALLLALIVQLVIPGQSKWWAIPNGVFLGLSLLLWFFGSDSWNSRLARCYIKQRFRNPRIGMLTTGGITTAGASKNFSESDWRQAFETSREPARFQDIGPQADVRSVRADVLVNPLEEHYPEIDLANQTRLKELTEFVRRGGVLVATGGLPFFWMIDSADLLGGRKGFTGAPLSMFVGQVDPTSSHVLLQQGHNPRLASLLDTWLSKTFGVITTLGDRQIVTLRPVQDPYFSDLLPKDRSLILHEFRAPIRCDSRQARLIPIVEADWRFGPHLEYVLECYPIAAVGYGTGYLLVFAATLRKENAALASGVIQRVFRKLKEEGRLD